MPRNGSYVKDLTVVEPDLSRVCLVDNSPASYSVNQGAFTRRDEWLVSCSDVPRSASVILRTANGIPIEGWINDPNDECLLDLLPMLDSLRFTNDVRRVLGLRGFGKRESGGGGVGMVAGGASRGRMR
jgi:CTD nuclear envelope phosphatase 1